MVGRMARSKCSKRYLMQQWKWVICTAVVTIFTFESKPIIQAYAHFAAKAGLESHEAIHSTPCMPSTQYGTEQQPTSDLPIMLVDRRLIRRINRQRRNKRIGLENCKLSWANTLGLFMRAGSAQCELKPCYNHASLGEPLQPSTFSPTLEPFQAFAVIQQCPKSSFMEN